MDTTALVQELQALSEKIQEPEAMPTNAKKIIGIAEAVSALDLAPDLSRTRVFELAVEKAFPGY